MDEVVIRKYATPDRDQLRLIACETAFLELPRKKIFTDDKILADSLTLYFTDFEPESSFVAVIGDKVVGYLTGAKDTERMLEVEKAIEKRVFFKAISRGVFFRLTNLIFFYYVLRSLFRREFKMPDFSTEYPAIMHINIDKDFRNHGIGKKLIAVYIDYLINNQVKGVYLGTLSERAKDFFLKNNFNLLFQGKRTYFSPYLNREVSFYILGRNFYR